MASVVSGDDLKGQVSATFVVLVIYPQITREMIHNTIPPKGVWRLIKTEVNQSFMKQFTPKERRMISKLDSDGYNDLDLPCLYKVIRYFLLIPTPRKGWGQRPQPEDQSEGDDIERMKRHCSDIIHRTRARLTESERHFFSRESIEIAKRMDNRIGSPKNGFESRIQNVQSNLLIQEKYVEALEKNAEYQGIVPIICFLNLLLKRRKFKTQTI
ncbi:DZIP3 [Mytilus edulis]|uniref:DZIP3 n=1 Tax=Mytilus edulis TaxID=6550 RepID=A0A8S3U592_MYTED|nr:DZIP3 [Mytilus edulis]